MHPAQPPGEALLIPVNRLMRRHAILFFVLHARGGFAASALATGPEPAPVSMHLDHEGAEAIVEAIVDAALEGADGRAGLILCALYGESPAVLERLVELARTRGGVVGIDLAGGPSEGDEHRLEDYAEAFTRARELGIGRTVHAGEGRPPAEIRTAIERLHAGRIGHGTSLLEEPALVELVLERGVTLEACPTSNWQTGAIAELSQHPLPRWLALGIRACVCTDNVLFSAVTSPSEHWHAATMPGMSWEMLLQAIRTGHEAAFRRG
jgi:adenosine deaminase